MTTWTFDGTDLASFGKITLIDDYLNFADRRGDNITVPFRHGTVHVDKYFDERVIAMGIALVGTSAQDLEDTYDSLCQLLAPMTRKTLECTRESALVVNAQATVNKSLDIQRFSDKIAKVLVEFTLNSPFFRDKNLIADNTTTINASPKAMVVTNPGSVQERDPIILLSGPLTNPEITNLENDCVLKYNGVIDAGETVTIQTSVSGEYTANHSVDGNVIGNVSHSGAAALMVIEVGSNDLSITSDVTTTGTVKISFNAPYL
jgi:hypothetical protein